MLILRLSFFTSMILRNNNTYKMDLNLDWSASYILDSPKSFLTHYPLSSEEKDLVQRVRNQISDILSGKLNKLLVIVGPCSLHDPKSAIEYATRLAELQKEVPHLLLVMRAYFEKPRTVGGWKGLIYDPDIDGSCNLQKGIHISRKILIDILQQGITPATEFLDTILPQYISDTIVWGAIGARTVESQVHRQLASGTSCPIGFKNSSSGNIRVAIDAALSGQLPHAFPGINSEGKACLIRTTGNKDSHIILRGSYENGPNYMTADEVFNESNARDLKSKLIVDCSHGNSNKNHEQQTKVVEYLGHILSQGCNSIGGIMIESNLKPGKQPISKHLSYGVSITDSCIGFEETSNLLKNINNLLTIKN